MEFRRAQRDEPVDEGLWAEHWRRISPVLHRRWVFAGARGFLLYDLFSDAGHVNEDVYAYSNQAHGAAALVLFHNRHADAHGWIRMSAAYADKDGDRSLRQRPLAEGLSLQEGDRLVRCRELVRGREHLFHTEALRREGLRVELGPYQSRVFVDWQAVVEDHRPWRELARRSGAEGIADLDAELSRMASEPAQRAFRELCALAATDTPGRAPLLAEGAVSWAALAAPLMGRARPAEATVRENVRASLARLEALRKRMARLKRAEVHTWLPAAAHEPERDTLLAVYAMLRALGETLSPDSPDHTAGEMVAAMGLRSALAEALGAHVEDPEDGWRAAARLGLVFAHRGAMGSVTAWHAFLDEPDTRWLIGVEQDEDTLRFDRDAFLALAGWMELPALLGLVDERELGEETTVVKALTPAARLARWGKRATRSKGRFEALREAPAS